MRFRSHLIPCLLLSVLVRVTPVPANGDPQAALRAEIDRRYRLDPASSLDSRVRKTPATVLKLFVEGHAVRPTPHTLTAEERLKLSAAFAALPPLHQQVLRERLRSVSFLDGMPNTALTSTVNPDTPFQLFDITIRAAILHQTASEWLTEKERSCFDAAGSPLSVSIEAGQRDAIVYVLLHEATHILDASLGITPSVWFGKKPTGGARPTAFTRGVWKQRATPVPAYHDPLREHVRFYAGGKTLPMARAEAVYRSLRRTPFASLYGSSNWYEDLAEYVAVYHWTEVLKQPYRIVIRKEGKEVFAYEPMQSSLVRSRAGQMKRFYQIL